jgi:hypothetical protein
VTDSGEILWHDQKATKRAKMKARKLIALLATSVVIAGFIAGPATTATGAPKATAVGKDPAGDWGANQDSNLNPFGDAMGMDLVGAEIGRADAKTLNFVIKVNSLPPTGGTPEVARYTWDFLVDGEQVELDGKFTNYSRGTCDPTAGSCPPPRDPGSAPFLVRGNCSAVENVTTCEEIGIVNATFDAAAGSITIPVPMALIKAKKGSKIAPAAGTFSGTISAAPAAFLTYGDFPMDLLIATKTYKVS